MTGLGHYFLLLLIAIVLILWAASWLFAPSTRAKHWLLSTAGLFIPFSLGMIWWWSWPLATLSLLPNPWNTLELMVAICLIASLLASYARRLAKLPFEQSLQIRWPAYLATMISLFLVGQLAPSLPWSNFSTFSVLLLLIAIVGILTIHRRQLAMAQLITMLLTIIIAALLGLTATQLDPTLRGIGLNHWRIAWTWPQLLTLISIAAAWPVLTLWWLNQVPARSMSSK